MYSFGGWADKSSNKKPKKHQNIKNPYFLLTVPQHQRKCNSLTTLHYTY